MCRRTYGTKVGTFDTSRARACWSFATFWSKCPLRLALGKTSPAVGLPAALQRNPIELVTVKGATKRGKKPPEEELIEFRRCARYEDSAILQLIGSVIVECPYADRNSG